MSQFRIRYNPEIEILYTAGNELITIDGLDYSGYYRRSGINFFSYDPTVLSNISKTKPIETSGIQLVPKSGKTEDWIEYTNQNNSVLVNRFRQPDIYYPSPEPADYEKGYIFRYFLRKRNSNEFTEISKQEKDQVSETSPLGKNISSILYETIEVQWKISGPDRDVKKNGMTIQTGIIDTNQRTINDLAKLYPGIETILSNPMELSNNL